MVLTKLDDIIAQLEMAHPPGEPTYTLLQPFTA